MFNTMKKIFLLLILIVMYSCNRFDNSNAGFNTKLTSIDSLKLSNLLDEMALSKNSDSVEVKASILLELFPNHKAKINEQIAHVFYAKGNLHLTKFYFEQSAKNYLKLGDELKYAEQLTNVGVVNELTGENPGAIENYHKALVIFRKSGEELKCSYVYNNLGIVYQKFGDFNNSMLNYKKSMLICLKLNEKQKLISKYNNIGSLFEKHYGDLDSALYYYEKASLLSAKSNRFKENLIIEANIANIFIKKGEYERADSLLEKTLDDTIHLEFALNTINKFKAELLLKKGEAEKAGVVAKKVVDNAKNKDFKDDEIYALQILIDCYVAQNKFKEAYFTLEDKLVLNEEVIGVEQKKEVERLNVKFAVQEKDNLIKLLELKEDNTKKRNRIFYIVLSVVILLLLALLYIFYLQKKHSIIKIKMMQNDIARYIKQIHNFEDEIHEQELSHHELFLQKVKHFGLTEREEEVLLHISNGLKNNEIASIMFVSINTVKTHIKNIFVKLDVRNRIEATNKAKVG